MSTTELRCFLKWIRSVWASALASTTIILELRSFFHAEALSSKDTLLHIKRVNELLLQFAKELMDRAVRHDNSKLHEPEKPLFDKMTPHLKTLTYGSEEYKKSLAELKPALDHHYTHNSHHPEFYKDGINDFDLVDLVEMICDWKAASERHEDGNIFSSIQINKERFSMSDQLAKIFENTVNKLFE